MHYPIQSNTVNPSTLKFSLLCMYEAIVSIIKVILMIYEKLNLKPKLANLALIYFQISACTCILQYTMYKFVYTCLYIIQLCHRASQKNASAEIFKKCFKSFFCNEIFEAMYFYTISFYYNIMLTAFVSYIDHDVQWLPKAICFFLSVISELMLRV